MAQIVDVFIASPSDVKKERLYAEDIVHLVSLRTRDSIDIALHTVSWPNFMPSATKCSTEQVQDRFSNRVSKCGIFVGILCERYGTEINEERKISGTQEEFEYAILHRNSIEILSYFKKPQKSISTDREKLNQFSKLNNLKDQLREKGIFNHDYDKPAKFRERFIFDLFQAVLKIRTEAERREQLQSFFKFGIRNKRFSPSVLLGYPPIHKHFPYVIHNSELTLKKGGYRKQKYNWQERLLPNVVYEDVKCIQKIEAAVRLSGVQDISSVTLDHPKLSTDQGNRIWLCLPRNGIAQRKLAQLEEKARFKFERHPGENRPHIIWKHKGENTIIKSPMEKYLIHQNRPKKSNWDPKYGSIVARDFAVIARFSMESTKGLTKGDPYYHYFIAGIRGLGTWGAGWFIDRRTDELFQIVKKYENEGTDPQILLEVTFSNYRIIDVKDVGECKAEYFMNQMEDAEINRVIEKYR